jgi:hypothetical protein
MSITSHIRVSATYTRSVNLERDSQSGSSDLGYIPTSRALRTLGTIASRFSAADCPRAWSLVGPYGSGKSSFALFLSHLLADPGLKTTQAAQRLLKKTDSDLEAILHAETKGTQGYVEVLISGTPERLSLRYLRGLQEAMVQYWQGRKGKKPTVFTELAATSNKGEVSVSELLELTKACQAALAKVGCPGLMIVFDEFGKFLEFESRAAGVNDAFLLQAIAEHAHAANSTKILVLVLLHQSIEQYARGVGESLKNEWAKIQGRFEEVPFLESAEQTLRVVNAAITQKPFDEISEKAIYTSIVKAIDILSEEGVLPSSLKKTEAHHLFRGLYPLHPLSAMILPQLCQLISQNERTLFSYLGSREQSGFRDMLNRLEKPGDFITPDHIFDYFLSNQPSVNGDYLTQRRWAESVSVIDRIHDASNMEMAVLKTVGLINLLGNRGSMRASANTLESSFGAKGKSALNKLTKLSALVYRKFNNEYRVWQGSDFDLEGELQSQINQQGPFSLAEKITENQSLPPLVARKYSIENGALRYFTLAFVDALTYTKVAAKKTPQIFIFLSSGQDDQKLYDSLVKTYLSKVGLVAYHDGGQTLKSLVSERLALEAIGRSAKQLSEDPVAKKEFETRLSTITQAEIRHVSHLITNPQSSDWTFHEQALQVTSRREFQIRLSQVLQKIFPKAPIVHNELINRDKPSSQAAAARNKLLNLLLTDVDKADLGIAKFPPEKAIYRSVLRETQIHRKVGDKWALCKPPKGSSLLPAWERVEDFFASTDSAARPFSDINAELISPPYGIKAGLLPVLWLSVYLVNEHELALYEERKYIPGFNQELLERFVKRPDQFSVQRFKIDGLNASIFNQYCKVVSGGAEPKTILDIAKPLATFMGNLPEYTLKTKTNLSDKAIAVRTAFNLSKSPESLIFHGLPKALGYQNLVNDEKAIEGFAEKLTGVLRELRQAHQKLVTGMCSRFAGILGLDPKTPLEKLRSESRGRCSGLESYTLDAKGVRGLLVRIAREDGDDHQWFENILMFLGSKPSQKWTDADKDEADYKLVQLSRRLTELFKLAAEERRFAEHTDGDFDVYLLKSLRKGADFIDEVVTIDKAKKEHAESIRESLEAVLSKSNDKELQLAALAQVVDEFLLTKRESEKGVKRNDVSSRVYKSWESK